MHSNSQINIYETEFVEVLRNDLIKIIKNINAPKYVGGDKKNKVYCILFVTNLDKRSET